MNKTRSTCLAFSLFLLGQAACVLPSAHAGSYDYTPSSDSGSKDFKGSDLGEGNFSRQKFSLTFDTRVGYDDNSNAQPDTFTAAIFNPATGKTSLVTRDSDQNDSMFINWTLGAGYTIATPRFTLTLGADIGVNYYFDRDGRDYDVNGGLSLRATYKLTPRAFLEFSSYNAYESDGGYGASNLSGFSGTLGTSTSAPGTNAQLDGDYFYTSNRIALNYQFTPRISAAFSDSFVAFAYEDEPYSTIQDRIENYFSTEGRYLLLPNLTLALQYRFGYIDYFGVDNDSYSNFALAGVDYTFSPRLKGTFRAGVEFRRYFDAVGDEDSPYLESAITYDISRRAHISFSLRYGIEEGDLSTDNTKNNAVRLGLDYQQNITNRISIYSGFYYTHSYYQTPAPVAIVGSIAGIGGYSNYNENVYDIALGARYAVNRHLSVEIGYTHTSVDSDLDSRSYDRNRYFAGVRLAY